ncbi:MAG: DUF3782 domain-containing protein, partial [Bacteroidia bacterium]|nr:DUF3782 domain-containing protein [Bacteroidia bacterium]
DDIDKQNAINEKMLDDIDKQNVINEKMLDDIDKQNVINEKMLANIEDLNTKYTVNIGAIGQRWGMASEASFRNALKAILEKSFPVKVINYNKMDTECLVYEKPTPVEIDVIIYNGITILCEIKASVSRGDVYDFVKKIHYYEKKENVEVTRKIIISPMIDSDAIQEAEYYGMEVYSTPKEIKLMD